MRISAVMKYLGIEYSVVRIQMSSFTYFKPLSDRSNLLVLTNLSFTIYIIPNAVTFQLQFQKFF